MFEIFTPKYSQVSIIRPGLIFSLRDFLYYIAIEVKEVTQQKYKTWSYNRDERVDTQRYVMSRLDMLWNY